MEGLLLYCFSDQPLPEAVSGIDDQAIQCRDVDGVYVMYSPISDLEWLRKQITSKEEDLKKHPAFKYQAITKRIHQKVSTLPLKLPTITKNLAEIDALVKASRVKIQAFLKEYGTLTEHSFYLKAVPDVKKLPEELANDRSDGISYLKKKYVQHQMAAELTSKEADVKHVFEESFSDEMVDFKLEKQGQGLKVHLLTKSQENYTSSKIESLRHELRVGFSTHYLGSYPPFHFVNLV